MFFKQYVDHIFALFSSPVNAKEFKEYLPSKYPNIHFSEEKKKVIVYLIQILKFLVKTGDLYQFLSKKTFSAVILLQKF